MRLNYICVCYFSKTCADAQNKHDKARYRHTEIEPRPCRPASSVSPCLVRVARLARAARFVLLVSVAYFACLVSVARFVRSTCAVRFVLRRPLRPAIFSLQLELAVQKSSFSWSWLAKIAVQLELDAIFTVQLDLALLKSTFSWTWRGFMDTMV